MDAAANDVRDGHVRDTHRRTHVRASVHRDSYIHHGGDLRSYLHVLDQPQQRTL